MLESVSSSIEYYENKDKKPYCPIFLSFPFLLSVFSSLSFLFYFFVEDILIVIILFFFFYFSSISFDFVFASSKTSLAPLLLDSHQRCYFLLFCFSAAPDCKFRVGSWPFLTTAMGDLHVNGVVFGEDRPCASSPPSPPLPPWNPDPSSVAADAWAAAERNTAEILRRIRPTLAADRRRREVVDYVQRLIRYGARCEVMFDSRQCSIFVVLVLFLYAWFVFQLKWIDFEWFWRACSVFRFLFCYGFDDCEGVGHAHLELFVLFWWCCFLKLGLHWWKYD